MITNKTKAALEGLLSILSTNRFYTMQDVKRGFLLLLYPKPKNLLCKKRLFRETKYMNAFHVLLLQGNARDWSRTEFKLAVCPS